MSNGLNSSWHFGPLVVALLLGGVVVNAWEYLGEARVERRELSDFPIQLGRWQQVGGDERFDAQTEGVLRADDYLLRNYKLSDGRVASLYVGYYASQRNGATYHSPLNCLPGSGWIMTNPEMLRISPANGGAPFEANRYLIQNGGAKQLLVYWYQGRGRVVASEYWGKVYTVLDSVRLRRSDGAMVRVTTPVGKSESEALRAAADLAASAAPVLPSFVPN